MQSLPVVGGAGSILIAFFKPRCEKHWVFPGYRELLWYLGWYDQCLALSWQAASPDTANCLRLYASGEALAFPALIGRPARQHLSELAVQQLLTGLLIVSRRVEEDK